VAAAGLLALAGVVAAAGQDQQRQRGEEGFRFRSGVELVNVTATVTDGSGRFVPGLRMEDFILYEDGKQQAVTHFSNERVPVSLGIALDASGSMAGDKMVVARGAIDRFLEELLDPADEIFLYRFASQPHLVQEWTTDRARLQRALRSVNANGGTALYDAVAEAVPVAETGQLRKKALVVISDGNDTSSETDVDEVKQLIRETEVLVYAIGIDGNSPRGGVMTPRRPMPQPPFPFPFPIPGRRPQPPQWPAPPSGGGVMRRGADDRVNVAALRELTDDSGGRTEIVRSVHDLDSATANVADELSKQYYLGYTAASEKDGRWHTIRVELRKPGYRVRARRGYVAS
jgi:Ca-activated chloride channel family protein